MATRKTTRALQAQATPTAGRPSLRLVPRVPRPPDPDVVDQLEQLLVLARAGEIKGLIFGADVYDCRYFVDAAGSLDRCPITARGICSSIDDDLRARVERDRIN